MRVPKYFLVDHRDSGCVGRKISILSALKLGRFSPYDDLRIKHAFNFGNGTFTNLEIHALNNNQSILTPDEFWQFALPLGDAWRVRTEGWVADVLNNRGL